MRLWRRDAWGLASALVVVLVAALAGSVSGQAWRRRLPDSLCHLPSYPL
jgi:hypothetical protein